MKNLMPLIYFVCILGSFQALNAQKSEKNSPIYFDVDETIKKRLYQYWDEGEIVEMLGVIIIDPSPLLKSIHRKLYDHNAVIHIIPIVNLCPDRYRFKLDRIILIKLIQDLALEFILRLLPYDPMLASIESV